MEVTQGRTFCLNPSNDDRESTPNSNPTTIVFLGLDNEDYPNHLSSVAMKPRPFCQSLFEPTWDVKFVFCQHSYHSWCALNHFSTSTKCLFKRCWQEMHPN